MAAHSAALTAQTNTQRRLTTKSFVVKTSEIVYELVGIDSNGDLVAWADTAGHKFVGILEGGPVTGDDTATPAVRATVRIDGPRLEGVDVAGVTDRNSIGAPVYCATDNVADLSLTATSNVKPIGRLIDWRSNSDMDVELYTTEEHLAHPLVADITALTDNTGGTADNTLANLADGTTYANDHATIENNFADLAAKVNEILTALNIN